LAKGVSFRNLTFVLFGSKLSNSKIRGFEKSLFRRCKISFQPLIKVMTKLIALPKICLASQSPRRRQLLETLGLKFVCHAPQGDEAEANSKNVESTTQKNSLAKALEIQRAINDDSVVVGADTLVTLDDVVLGKPRDRDDAQQMLERLSGKTHRVVTGLTLISKNFGMRQLAEESRVTFSSLGAGQISDYLDTKEPYDKAGSYAVQGLGCLFIDRIEGSYTNVMGLPVERFLIELASLTGIPTYDWFK
jgi:septum formation protein